MEQLLLSVRFSCIRTPFFLFCWTITGILHHPNKASQTNRQNSTSWIISLDYKPPYFQIKIPYASLYPPMPNGWIKDTSDDIPTDSSMCQTVEQPSTARYSSSDTPTSTYVFELTRNIRYWKVSSTIMIPFSPRIINTLTKSSMISIEPFPISTISVRIYRFSVGFRDVHASPNMRCMVWFITVSAFLHMKVQRECNFATDGSKGTRIRL